MDEIQINFTKMTGAGNDFILIDNRSGLYSINWEGLAPELCDRRYGVGADGLLIVENSSKADFEMKYYNSDGSYGGMCGNGGRCIAKFMMDIFNKRKINFEALGYIYSADRLGNDIYLKMKPPKIINHNMLINIDEDKVEIFIVDTGAPHAVIFLDDVSQNLNSKIKLKGILSIGSFIRNHDILKPTGTNVNFAVLNQDRSISMRTYERGVENETLACGTGAIACAIAASIKKDVESPVIIKTQSGEILTVKFSRIDAEFNNVELIGSAKEVFTGIYKYNNT